jgi:oligosaccharide repeat unit polymerase
MRVFMILVPAAGLYLAILSLFKFKRLLNPVLIVVCWWAFWLWISNFSLTGFFVPSDRTQVMVLVMLGSVSLGGLLAFAGRRQPEKTDLANERFISNGRYLFWLNVLFVPLLAFLMARAVPALLSSEPVRYRMEVYGTPDGPSPLFGAGYNQFLFFLVVSPVIFFSLIAGLISFFRFGRKKLLLISGLLIIVEGIITLGRFNFYYLLALAAFAFAYAKQRRTAPAEEAGQTGPPRLKLKAVKFTVASAAVLAAVLGLSFLRGEKNIGPLAALEKIAVEYHTVGLVLFDQELQATSSRLNSGLSYGRSTIGGLDSLALLFLRRFNPDIVPVAQESGAYMAEAREVGRDARGEPILGNAFYTILYSLYYDGRYPAVVVFSLVFGFFLARSWQGWIRNGRLASLSAAVLLTYVGVFSIFQSPVEGLKFWVALLFIPVMNRFTLSFLKPERPETDG